jgi:hypothetical protein
MPNDKIGQSDQIKTLLEFYKDNVTYQRHHEDIRFKSSQLIVSLAAALIAFLKFTNGSVSNYASALFIVLLGLLGVAQVLKHTERADRHARLARAYRVAISELSDGGSGSSVEAIHDAAAETHKQKAGLIYCLRARWFWLCMHFAIILVGLGIGILQFLAKLN